MHSKYNITAYFLMLVYGIFALHQVVFHNKGKLTDVVEIPFEETHQHDSYEDMHHEHTFHVGIFHFIAHLFQDIEHDDNVQHDHVIASNDFLLDAKQISGSINVFFDYTRFFLLTVEPTIKTPRGPPHYLPLAQQLVYSDTPLRAPPALV